MKGKTIATIADELGLSKQAIHQKINKEPLKSKLKGSLYTIGNKRFIDNQGEMIIKSLYIKSSTTLNIDNNIDNIDKHVDDNDNEVDDKNVNIDKIVNILEQNIKILQQQLEIKDKQIDELTNTVKLQAESINAERKNELAETIIGGTKLIDKEYSQDKKKSGKSFFKKLFSKNKEDG